MPLECPAMMGLTIQVSKYKNTLSTIKTVAKLSVPLNPFIHIKERGEYHSVVVGDVKM